MIALDSPQLENGYTAIAHEILEQMAKIKLSPTQYRLIFVIWRYTYGFRRKEHELSLSFLSKATGCDKRQIQRELSKLEVRKIIAQKVQSGVNRKVRFNKHYKQWVGETTIGEIDNGETTIGEIVNTTIGETDNGTIGETDNQENYIKTNIKTKIYNTVFDYYISLDLVKHKTLNDSMGKAIDKAYKQHDIDEMKTMLDRHKSIVEYTKTSQYPVKPRTLQEFFGQKVKDGVILICEEYTDDGPKWLKYKDKLEEVKKYGATGTDDKKVYRLPKSFYAPGTFDD